MKIISENKAFGGIQGVYTHRSELCDCEMTFGLFKPAEALDGPVPVLWFLSGLTCTHENAMVKAGAQAWAAEQGVALIFPDTSPRGADVADSEDFDLGKGAGFYIDATQEPWAKNYAMESYIMEELTDIVFDRFSLDPERQAISGHSMGGHGALTLAMKYPDRFRSVSAFAPICNPAGSAWGQKQLGAYLGDNADFEVHDASHLMRADGLDIPLLVDTGTDDQFWDLLNTDALMSAISERRIAATVRLQEGYDHSYFFVSTFMEDHLTFHAEALYA